MKMAITIIFLRSPHSKPSQCNVQFGATGSASPVYGGGSYAPSSIVTSFANFPKNTNGSASSTMGGMKQYRKHIYQDSEPSAPTIWTTHSNTGNKFLFLLFIVYCLLLPNILYFLGHTHLWCQCHSIHLVGVNIRLSFNIFVWSYQYSIYFHKHLIILFVCSM